MACSSMAGFSASTTTRTSFLICLPEDSEALVLLSRSPTPDQQYPCAEGEADIGGGLDQECERGEHQYGAVHHGLERSISAALTAGRQTLSSTTEERACSEE